MTAVQTVLDEIRNRPGTGAVIPVIDPATEEQLTEFTDCGPEAVNDAVTRAKASSESAVWSGLPDYERARVLWRVADLIDENAGILAELESLNAGIPPAQAAIITKVGSEWFRYYAGWCTKIDGIARDVNAGGLTGIESHQHVYTLREPYQVVGLIFPWNGPVFNFCAKLAPALQEVRTALETAAAKAAPGATTAQVQDFGMAFADYMVAVWRWFLRRIYKAL